MPLFPSKSHECHWCWFWKTAQGISLTLVDLKSTRVPIMKSIMVISSFFWKIFEESNALHVVSARHKTNESHTGLQTIMCKDNPTYASCYFDSIILLFKNHNMPQHCVHIHTGIITNHLVKWIVIHFQFRTRIPIKFFNFCYFIHLLYEIAENMA